MTRARTSAILVAVLAPLLVLLGAAPGQATAQTGSTPYPVPYTFLTSAVLAGLNPNANAPGSNDWTCKPSAAHPRPVVLVHGLTGNRATNWQTFSPLLANNGYCVFALTYGKTSLVQAPWNQYFGGFNDMTLSAQELADFVTKVRAATGAAQVDLLGHSEGTVISGYYAKFLAQGQVANVVSLAPIWHGTDPAGLATLSKAGTPFGITPVVMALFKPYFASGPQLLAGSDFMNDVPLRRHHQRARREVHQRRDEVRRARGPLHQRHRAGRDERDSPGRVQHQLRRALPDRRRPPRRPGRAQRPRPGAQQARPVRPHPSAAGRSLTTTVVEQRACERSVETIDH